MVGHKMNTQDGDVRLLRDINESIKRHSVKLAELRIKKKEVEKRLYKYMEKNNIQEYSGYKIEKIAPKEKRKIKKKSEKKQDAIRLFIETGITDPETFWEAFQETQKARNEDV